MKPCPLQTKSAGSRCGVTRQVVRLSERVAHERAQHVHAVNTPQDRRTGRAGEGARTTINLPAQGSGKSAPPPKVRRSKPSAWSGPPQTARASREGAQTYRPARHACVSQSRRERPLGQRRTLTHHTIPSRALAQIAGMAAKLGDHFL